MKEILTLTIILTILGFYRNTIFSTCCLHVQDVLTKHKFYKMLTAGFVHNSYSHLIYNLVPIIFFIPHLQNALGNYTPVLYVASIILGSLFVVTQTATDGQVICAGASAGANGLITCALIVNTHIPFFTISVPTCILAIAYIAILIGGLPTSKASFNAHLGGGMAGIIAAMLATLHNATIGASVIILAISFLIITVLEMYASDKK